MMKRGTGLLHPRLKTRRLALRLPAAGDIDEIIRFYQDNAVHFAPFTSPKPAVFYTRGYWVRRVNDMASNFESDRAVNFFVFPVREPRRIIGYVNFFPIVRGAFQAVTMGYGIDAGFQGRGLMTEACGAAIRYVFTDLNLHRVMANHDPHNRRSAAVLKRLGFSREGIARHYLLVHGKWRDHILNSLVNRRWKDEPSAHEPASTPAGFSAKKKARRRKTSSLLQSG